MVVGDAGRFGQVLVNLVGNAVKFTTEGGVRVDVEQAPSRPGDPPGLVRVRASVRDTGIGIPADKHALIFEAFTQADGSTSRRFGGTGLGLSIAARIVKRMGGTLQVSSAPGEGSTFTLVVPFERGEQRGTAGAVLRRPVAPAGPRRCAAAAVAGPAQTLRPLRVLLVEDNPVNQRLAHEILSRRGHRVTVAENGREALDRLSEATFDIVLMDVQMPEMNGLDATRAIRAGEHATGRHVPIVAMTAHAMAGDRERCLAAGMDEYLTKPIRAEALISHVERFAMATDPSSVTRTRAGVQSRRGPAARGRRPRPAGRDRRHLPVRCARDGGRRARRRDRRRRRRGVAHRAPAEGVDSHLRRACRGRPPR